VRRLRKFLGLTWAERLLLLEAWLYLGGARAALLLLPFRRIAPHLGRQVPPDDPPVAGTPSDSIAQVASAVETMSFHTPWESACLAQAIAAKLMLRRRGFASMLYLGTRKDEDGKLAAHAWLKTDGAIVIGGAGHETFTALSAFDEPPKGS
jgi:hypothetical protein